jgi:hypothetical protein
VRVSDVPSTVSACLRGTPVARRDVPRLRRCPVIQRPAHIGAFQFVVVATLRAAQLMRGCVPRVDGLHKVTVTAQLEVSEGRVAAIDVPPAVLVQNV